MNKFKIVLVILFFLNFIFGFGQNTSVPKEDVKSSKENLTIKQNLKTVNDSIDLKSEPYEGFHAFYANVQKNIRVPMYEVSGTYRTIISFIVDTDGTLMDFSIVQETPIKIGLGEEVIRVLKTFPKWKPSSKKSHYKLPVTAVVEEEPLLKK